MHIQGPNPLSRLNNSELKSPKPVQSAEAVPLPPPESEICCTDKPKFQKFSDYEMARPNVHLCAWEPDQENHAPKVMRCAFEPDQENHAPKVMRCAWDPEITSEPRPHLDDLHPHLQPKAPREGIYNCSFRPERELPPELFKCVAKPNREDDLPPQLFKCVAKR